MAEYSNPFQNGDLFYKFVSANKDQQNDNNLEVEDVFGNTINFSDYGVSRIVSRDNGEQNLIFEPNTPQAQEFDTSFMDRMVETHYDPNSEPVIVQPIQEQVITQPIQEQTITQPNFNNKSYSINQSLSGNKKRAMEFFQSKGLLPYQAAGIVANLLGESNLNHTAVNPHSKAYGIAQWLGPRKKQLFNKYGKNPTFEQQLEFVWEELNSTEKSAYNRLLQTRSLDEAVNSFMKHFERPSQREMAQSINRRLKFGRSLLQ